MGQPVTNNPFEYYPYSNDLDKKKEGDAVIEEASERIDEENIKKVIEGLHGEKKDISIDNEIASKNNAKDIGLPISRNDIFKNQEERWSTLQIENNNIEVLGNGNKFFDFYDGNNQTNSNNKDGRMKAVKRRRKPFDSTKFAICSFCTEILDTVDNEQAIVNKKEVKEEEKIIIKDSDNIIDNKDVIKPEEVLEKNDKQKENDKGVDVKEKEEIKIDDIDKNLSNEHKDNNNIEKENKEDDRQEDGQKEVVCKDDVPKRNERKYDNYKEDKHKENEGNEDEHKEDEQKEQINKEDNKNEGNNDSVNRIKKDKNEEKVNEVNGIENNNKTNKKDIFTNIEPKAEEQILHNDVQQLALNQEQILLNKDDNTRNAEIKLNEENIGENKAEKKITFGEENNLVPDQLHNEEVTDINAFMLTSQNKDEEKNELINALDSYLNKDENDIQKNQDISNNNLNDDNKDILKTVEIKELRDNNSKEKDPNTIISQPQYIKSQSIKTQKEIKQKGEGGRVNNEVNDDNKEKPIVIDKDNMNNNKDDKKGKVTEIQELTSMRLDILNKAKVDPLVQSKVQKQCKEKENIDLSHSVKEQSKSQLKDKSKQNSPQIENIVILNNKDQTQDNDIETYKKEKESSKSSTQNIPIPPPFIDLTNLYTLAKKSQQQRYRIIKHPAIEVIDNPFKTKNKNQQSNSHSFISDVKKNNNHSLSKDSNSGELTKLKENLSKNVDSKKVKKRGRGRRTIEDKQMQLQQQQLQGENNNLKDTSKKQSDQLSKVESEKSNPNRTITIERLPEVNTNELKSTHTELSKESNEDTEDFRNRTFTQNKKYEFHPNYSKDSSANSNEDKSPTNNYGYNSNIQKKRELLYNSGRNNQYNSKLLKKHLSKDNKANNKKSSSKGKVIINKGKKNHSQNPNNKIASYQQSKLKIGSDDKTKLTLIKNKQHIPPVSVLSKGKKNSKLPNDTMKNNPNPNSTNKNSSTINNHPIQLRNVNQNTMKNNNSANVNNNNSTNPNAKLSSSQEWKTVSVNKPLSSITHKENKSDSQNLTNPLIPLANKTHQDFRPKAKPSTYFPVSSCCNCQHVHGIPHISDKDLNTGYEYWLENRKKKTFSSKTCKSSSAYNIHSAQNYNKPSINLNYNPYQGKSPKDKRKTFTNLTNEEIEKKRKQLLDVMKDPNNPYSTHWQDKFLSNNYNMGITACGTINHVPVLTIVKKKEEPTEEKFQKIQQELKRQKSLETSKYYNKSSSNLYYCPKDQGKIGSGSGSGIGNGFDFKKLNNYEHIEYPSIFKYFN